MVDNPLVSIIVPTFNSLYLDKAVQSVINQTYKNIEILVIDDGSDDYRVVKKFGRNLIKYFRVSHTGNPAGPRNLGVAHAKGELMAFLDSDDFWLPEKLEEQIKLIKKGYDLVHCDGSVINESGRVIKESFHQGMNVPLGMVFSKLFYNNFIATSSVLVKKDCLDKVGNFNTSKDFQIGEDYDLWLRIAEAFSIGYVPLKLFVYRESRKSLSNQGVIRGHQYLFNILSHNFFRAKKIMGDQARARIYELCKSIVKFSKGKDNWSYLRFKFLCFIYFPWAISDRDSFIFEAKTVIKL